jgi:glycosyltransferase involved in cell wall biosynthesis
VTDHRLSWLLIATHVPAGGNGGGMVRYTVELANALRRREDVDLTVLARPEAQQFFAHMLEGKGEVAIAPGLATPALSLLEREGFGIPALRRRFDVRHGTKHLVPRRGGGQRVLTVHDMLPLDHSQEFVGLKRTLLARPYAASLRQATTLLCVSNATRERLCAHLPEARGKAFVVALATSSALRAVVPQPVPSLVGRPFALVVGDSSPRKNLALVVDIWPEVVLQQPAAVLAVVGPPSWGPTHVGEQHQQLSARGALHPLGWVDDSRLRWCYENAAVVLCPSLVEGFGLPALEALAFGAPLITSMDAALCEVSGAGALHLSATHPASWLAPVVAALKTGRPHATPPVARTWADVADETVAAVRRSADAIT